MTYQRTTPDGLTGAEVYDHVDGPTVRGRWYIRTDGSVVGLLPSGVWTMNPCVNATIVRSSRKWTRTGNAA